MKAVKLSGWMPQRLFVQVRQHLGKGPGIGEGLRERQPHPTSRDADPGPDLQQLQPKGRALGAGQLSAFSAECPSSNDMRQGRA